MRDSLGEAAEASEERTMRLDPRSAGSVSRRRSMERISSGEGHTADPSDVVSPGAPASGGSECVFSDAGAGIGLYRGNSLAFMDEIAEECPEGRFDTIFADPPISCPMAGSRAMPERWSRSTRARGIGPAARS